MRSFPRHRLSLAIAAIVASISCSLLPSGTAAGAKAPAWREVASMRTATSDTFTNGAGDFRTRLYSGRVNYRNGKAWKRIDSSLVVDGKAASSFENAANSFRVRLERSLKGSYLHFEAPQGRAGFSVSLQGATGARALRKGPNGLSYEEAGSHADLDYQVTPDGLKETIKLLDRSAPSSYVFELAPDKSEQLHALRARDGSVRFFGRGASKPAFSILAPTVTDSLAEKVGGPPAKGMASMSVQRQGDGRFRLALSIDRKWLSDPARTFPVSVDPSIATYDNTDGFYNYLSGVGAPPDTIHYLELGPRFLASVPRWDTYAIVINYDLSDGLSPIPRGAAVDGNVNASLHLRGCRLGIAACNTPGHYSGVLMYALNTPWSSTTPWQDVHYDPTVLASMSFYGNQTPTRYTLWDNGGALADKVQTLLDGETQLGFLFEASDPSGPSFSFDSYRDCVATPSSCAPYLGVSWHSVAPSDVDQPDIDGDTSDAGQTLSVVPGDSDGTWPLSYSYYWQRCNGSGGGCYDNGATGTQYVLTAADVGSTIRVRETVSNALGSVSASSDTTDVVGTAPSNDSPPTISGISSSSGYPKNGDHLTATTGAWSGSAVYQGHSGFRYDYQWYRCDSSGSNCKGITDATGSKYDLTPDDVGRTIEVEVTATNDVGSSLPAQSDPTDVVEEPPASTSPPTISGISAASGVPKDGDELTATTGTWSGSAVYSGDPGFHFDYEWRRCDSSGSNCKDITDATESNYDLTQDDVGSTIVVEVTASNDVGSTKAYSGPTRVVEEPPASTSPPTISGASSSSGIPKDGDVLSATTGTWSGSAFYQGSSGFHFDYQWLRCESSGANCNPIFGATDSSYGFTSGDVGYAIEVEVTASNDVGSASARSGLTGVVEERPASTSPPTVSGTARVAEKLNATAGTWSGSAVFQGNPGFHFDYRWLRCNSSGANCNPIFGASDSSYDLTLDDVGSTIEVEVTASNDVGSASATSGPTIEVQASSAIPASPGQGGSSGGNLGGITLQLSASPAVASPGEQVTYRLQATNTTSTERLLDHLSLDLPSGFDYDQSAIQGGPSVSPVVSDRTLEWSGLVELPAGETRTVTVGAGSALAPGTYFSGATATSQGIPIDPLEQAAAVQVLPDLAVLVTTDRDIADPNEPVEYTIRISNFTSAAFDLAQIRDTLPAGFAYRYGTTSGVLSRDPNPSGRSLVWSISHRLGSGQTIELRFKATAAPAGSGLSDYAEVAGSSGVLGFSSGAIVSVVDQGALALKYRPFVMFDESEPWRPLNVDMFLHEHYPSHKNESHQIGAFWLEKNTTDNTYVRKNKYSDIDLLASRGGADICRDSSDWGTCTPASAMKWVMGNDPKYQSSPGYVDDRYFVKIMGDRNAPDMHTCNNEPVDKRRCDHNRGSRTAIYYHVTSHPDENSKVHNYLDYWFFYRYNSPIWGGMDDHEGDWEHMIVNTGAPDRSDLNCPTGVTWVGFAAHGPLYKYKCGVLLWSGNKRASNSISKATPDQTHVDTYVAKGTHAMYPRPCFGSGDSCNQNKAQGWGPFTESIEGGFDGRAQWGRNSKEQCLNGTPCLLPILDEKTPGDGNVKEPRDPYWAYWRGYWGVTWTDNWPFKDTKSPVGPYWQGYNPDKQTLSEFKNTNAFEQPWLPDYSKDCPRTVFDNGNPGCSNSGGLEPVQVQMPNVIGKVWKVEPTIKCASTCELTENDAKTVLKGETDSGYLIDRRFRFVVTAKWKDSINVPDNHVITTEPKPGKPLFKGDPVTVWVSDGPPHVKMPDVIGKAWTSDKVTPDVKTRLTAKKYGYRFKVTLKKKHDSEIPNNHVIKTDPSPNESTRMKASVTVWVSTGPEPVTMPNVKKMPWWQKGIFERCGSLIPPRFAKTILKDKSCGYEFEVTRTGDYSLSVAKNHVIETKPKAGQKTRKGASVTVWVSKGPKPVTMPNVAGETLSNAKKTLTGSDYRFTIGGVEYAYNGNFAKGHVIRTDPAKNASTHMGASVTIWISKGKKPK